MITGRYSCCSRANAKKRAYKKIDGEQQAARSLHMLPTKSFTDADLALFFADEEEEGRGGNDDEGDMVFPHDCLQPACGEDECGSSGSGSDDTALADEGVEISAMDKEELTGLAGPAPQGVGAIARKRTKPERFGVEVFAEEASSLCRRRGRKKKRVVSTRARYAACWDSHNL